MAIRRHRGKGLREFRRRQRLEWAAPTVTDQRDVGAAGPTHSTADAEQVVAEERGEEIRQAPEVESARLEAAAAQARMTEAVVQLTPLGVREDLAQNPIRFGLGRFNTEEEVEYVDADRQPTRVRQDNVLNYGTVVLDWELVEESTGRELRLIWTEAGGPPVSAPVQRGFGSRLIERSARDQLGGEATVDFLPRGVVYTVICSLEDKS